MRIVRCDKLLETKIFLHFLACQLHVHVQYAKNYNFMDQGMQVTPVNNAPARVLTDVWELVHFPAPIEM